MRRFFSQSIDSIFLAIVICYMSKSNSEKIDKKMLLQSVLRKTCVSVCAPGIDSHCEMTWGGVTREWTMNTEHPQQMVVTCGARYSIINLIFMQSTETFARTQKLIPIPKCNQSNSQSILVKAPHKRCPMNKVVAQALEKWIRFGSSLLD